MDGACSGGLVGRLGCIFGGDSKDGDHGVDDRFHLRPVNHKHWLPINHQPRLSGFAFLSIERGDPTRFDNGPVFCIGFSPGKFPRRKFMVFADSLWRINNFAFLHTRFLCWHDARTEKQFPKAGPESTAD